MADRIRVIIIVQLLYVMYTHARKTLPKLHPFFERTGIYGRTAIVNLNFGEYSFGGVGHALPLVLPIIPERTAVLRISSHMITEPPLTPPGFLSASCLECPP